MGQTLGRPGGERKARAAAGVCVYLIFPASRSSFIAATVSAMGTSSRSSSLLYSSLENVGQ